MEDRLKLYLKTMEAHNGSDLHIKAGSGVRARINGELKVLGKEYMTNEQVFDLIKAITTDKELEKLRKTGYTDFGYTPNSKSRYRVNAFSQMEGYSLVMRVIPTDIPTIEELKLPDIIHSFTDIPRGLVLVTGVTGSGKSTTLAAMLNSINNKYQKHIITLEDPVEFVHKDNKCLINQRAKGTDFEEFADALPAALREDPDVILVGEMRDVETIELALHAANTGHLVFSTLHTLDAKETVNRIIGSFQKEEQNRIRLSLASVISGIVSQRLVPTVAGGRAAAVEVMVQTSRVKELIRDNRDVEIFDAIEEGKDIYGSQTFDQHLLEMADEGVITTDTALEYATSPSDLKLKFEGVGRSSTQNKNQEGGTAGLDAFDFKEED